MYPLNTKTVTFSLKCYAAAMLALAVAFNANLSNPWWAALTVYITSQPQVASAGSVWSRAIYRVAGTVLGVAAAVLIIPNFIGDSEVLVLVVAAWVAACLYLSLLDRSPRSYALLLAGYTLALVGLPTLPDPSRVFDVALGRTEEIIVGVLSAAFVQTIFLPSRATALFRTKLESTLSDAKKWILGALGGAAPDEATVRRKFAADLTELNLLAKSMRFEKATSRTTDETVWALEEALVAVLPMLTAVEDRVAALAAYGPMPKRLEELVQRIRDWIGGGADTLNLELSESLRLECHAVAPELHHESKWQDILEFNLASRLADLVESWSASLSLADKALRPQPRGLFDGWRTADRRHARSLHLDPGLAAFSGVAAALAIAVTCLFAINIGWSSGAAAAGITAAACSVFAFADDPTPFLRIFIGVSLASVPVAAFYQFAVLPQIDGYVQLAIALFPLFFATGVFLATPRHWLHAFAFALITQTLISLQTTIAADFVTFMNLAVAAVLGAVIAFVMMSTTRVLSADFSMRRIVRAGWRDLEGLASGSTRETREDWASRMLDRQALLIPRLAQAKAGDKPGPADALVDLRTGANIVALQDSAALSGVAAQRSIELLLRQLSIYFAERLRGGPKQAPASVLEAIDEAIAQILATAPADVRDGGVVAVSSLRRNLFSSSTAYRHQEPVA